MKTKLIYQDYGTAILIFIEADTKENAVDKYNSLFNWNATSSDPTFVNLEETIICCWSTKAKLKKYFWNLRIMQLWGDPKYKGVKGGAAGDAYKLAQEDFDATSAEVYRSLGHQFEVHVLGTIYAEKPDDDFKDSVINHGFSVSDI